MVSADRQEALFNQAIAKATGEPVKPGELALDFYTSFASPTKETYTWNNSLPQDFDHFMNGGVPLLVDYSYRTRDLVQKRPTFPFASAPLPQITGTERPATLATAQMIGVPTVSKNASAAWDFINFITNEQNSLAYARAAGRPPARIKLADPKLFDQSLQPFVAQLPYAKTWYRNDLIKTNKVFTSAIDAVLAGQPVPDVATRLTKQTTHILRNEPFE